MAAQRTTPTPQYRAAYARLYGGAAAARTTQTSHPADTLLARLDGVRESGHGQWMARCPAHDDRSPSLSVTERDDGVLLLKCHAQCETSHVLAAVGLSFGDLYPRDLSDHRGRPVRGGQRWSARDLLRLLAQEATVVAVAAGRIEQGHPLAEADRERLHQAAGRILEIASLAA